MHNVLVVAIFQRLENVENAIASFFLIETCLLHDAVEKLSTIKIFENNVVFVSFVKEIQLAHLFLHVGKFNNCFGMTIKVINSLVLTMFGCFKAPNMETSFRIDI